MAGSRSEKKVKLAVNGTLMRGLELNPSFLEAGAAFLEETHTAQADRLWSIQDRYPAMVRDTKGGKRIQVEVWRLSAEEIAPLLEREPPGLCIGQVLLGSDEKVLGVLGEPWVCEGQREITEWGGWRAYVNRESGRKE